MNRLLFRLLLGAASLIPTTSGGAFAAPAIAPVILRATNASELET